jgi:hypothetical protein
MAQGRNGTMGQRATGYMRQEERRIGATEDQDIRRTQIMMIVFSTKPHVIPGKKGLT